MVENVGRLARRHLITFVTLRDPQLDETAGARPVSRDALAVRSWPTASSASATWC